MCPRDLPSCGLHRFAQALGTHVFRTGGPFCNVDIRNNSSHSLAEQTCAGQWHTHIVWMDRCAGAKLVPPLAECVARRVTRGSRCATLHIIVFKILTTILSFTSNSLERRSEWTRRQAKRQSLPRAVQHMEDE